MRLIDADTLMEAMYHRAFETDGGTMWQSGCWVRYKAIEQTIKAQPTVKPSKRKGKWIEHPHGFWTRLNSGGERDGWLPDYECSVCGSRAWKDVTAYRYCPSCGAKMEGEG